MGKSIIILIVLLFLACLCSAKNPKIDKIVVTDFELNRYLGTWYEISRFDHKFERGLVGVTATYSLRENGKIKVENKGFEETLNGKISVAIGKAKIPDPNIPSKLKVSFFLFFYADYFVLELDENYQWAVIGSKSDKYLWILSRTPQMDENLYNELLNKLAIRGYDVTKLIKVEQKGD